MMLRLPLIGGWHFKASSEARETLRVMFLRDRAWPRA